MKGQIIDGVKVTKTEVGNSVLTMYIPQGMTSQDYAKWKKRNKKSLDKLYTKARATN